MDGCTNMNDINHLNVVGEVTPQELVKQCRAGFDMLAKALPNKRSLADQAAALELMAESARRAAEAIQQEGLRIEAQYGAGR